MTSTPRTSSPSRSSKAPRRRRSMERRRSEERRVGKESIYQCDWSSDVCSSDLRGGAGASRLNDINPEDIESIEIIKGPAAATLYGTEEIGRASCREREYISV